MNLTYCLKTCKINHLITPWMGYFILHAYLILYKFFVVCKVIEDACTQLQHAWQACHKWAFDLLIPPPILVWMPQVIFLAMSFAPFLLWVDLKKERIQAIKSPKIIRCCTRKVIMNKWFLYVLQKKKIDLIYMFFHDKIC